MSDFTVKIEAGHATATHRASGHVFEFSIAPTAPHIRGGTVRENQKADRGPDSLRQPMTAATGIRNREFNPSRIEPLHFLQIRLLPDQAGLAPGYEQKTFTDGENSRPRRGASLLAPCCQRG